MADNSVHVGPWGGNGGNPWKFMPDGRITQINIRSGNIVDAIWFSFTDRNGNTYRSVKYGGDGGFCNTPTGHVIPLEKDEEIVKIIGRTGFFITSTMVTSLTFVTNKNTYGQYGTDGGTDFSVPITKGKTIGFFGRHGDFIEAIGVILSP